jgi:hypothetical protein
MFWMPLLLSRGSQNSHVTVFGSIQLVFRKSGVLRTVNEAASRAVIALLSTANENHLIFTTSQSVFRIQTLNFIFFIAVKNFKNFSQSRIIETYKYHEGFSFRVSPKLYIYNTR